MISWKWLSLSAVFVVVWYLWFVDRLIPFSSRKRHFYLMKLSLLSFITSNVHLKILTIRDRISQRILFYAKRHFIVNFWSRFFSTLSRCLKWLRCDCDVLTILCELMWSNRFDFKLSLFFFSNVIPMGNGDSVVTLFTKSSIRPCSSFDCVGDCVGVLCVSMCVHV
jgi:hypothetical protein